ncbi:hypothetical protein [Rhizobium straminoryzae]|uniref:Uncharacterized protein n=1 Tax=Rhizobium straminoryzae TaxID=1387186 RepID=A0A549T0V8_9HYPH|nr:hypothetical protein [Rhizobium straminoryzae]TRL35514.1 hypothetical protein FNA46_20155 [Rhizobium straminoryzae]
MQARRVLFLDSRTHCTACGAPRAADGFASMGEIAFACGARFALNPLKRIVCLFPCATRSQLTARLWNEQTREGSV